MKLRDYQLEAIDATNKSFAEHDRSMIVLPTGMGKTEIFVEIARQHATEERDNNRVMVVAPSIELVDQAAEKLLKRTGVNPGIEQGQRKSNEYSWGRSPFVVSCKPTLCGRSERFRRFDEIGLVVVDECHLAATQQYKVMLDYFVDQGAKVLGVTATPKRHDRKAMANLFDTCPFEMHIADAVPLGWLVPPVTQCIQIQSMDLSSVGSKAAGDFKDAELARVLEDERVVFEIAEVTANESGNLKTVVFCATVAEARAVAQRLADRHKLKADWICSDTKLCTKERRQSVLQSFSGDPHGVQIVTNVGILTTGYDFPGLQHIVMGRPTKSLALYTQMFGRGTRPLPGVVDFEGSTPDARRDAIAGSDKPTFKVTDLYDNSSEHKLVGSFDVMAGEMGLDVVARAKNDAMNGAEVSVDEALAKAQRELEQEKYRKRRAAVAARARYERVEANPLDPNQAAPVAARKPHRVRMPFGKHKGQPLSAVPSGYLRYILDQSGKKSTWLTQAMAAELAARGQMVASQQAARRPVSLTERFSAMMAERSAS
ncbi:MAG: DEAD/DEAH box helicase family protein [Planctomycetota bacterium]